MRHPKVLTHFCPSHPWDKIYETLAQIPVDGPGVLLRYPFAQRICESFGWIAHREGNLILPSIQICSFKLLVEPGKCQSEMQVGGFRLRIGGLTFSVTVARFLT